MLGSPRWRKIARDLWRNKLRTMLVVLSVAVGVFAIGTVVHAYLIVARELTAIYPLTHPATSIIYADPFGDELVQSARRWPEVREAEGRGNILVRVQMGPDVWKPLLLFAIPDYTDIRINKIWPVYSFGAYPGFGAEETSWPPPERSVLFERSGLLIPGALLPANTAVGQTIIVETPDRKLRALKVAGMAHEPNRVPSTFVNVAYGYITYDTMEWLGGSRRMTQLQLIVSGNVMDREHIARETKAVRDRIQNGGYTVYGTEIAEPGKRPFVDDIFQGSLWLLSTLGFFSLFLSVFLVINTITGVLTQQTQQIGMMKAIGATRAQISELYLGMVLVFAALALLVAVPIAALVARETANYLAGFINVTFPAFSIPPAVIVVEVAVGLAVPLIAALYPIISGTRVTVREALSTYGVSKDFVGTSWIDRLVRHITALPRPLMLGLRNTFRRKRRLLFTLITLTLGGTIFIAVFTVRASLWLTLEDLLRMYRFDVTMSLSTSHRVEQIEAVARAAPGVANVEFLDGRAVRRLRANDTESENISMSAPRADSKLMTPKISEGRWLLRDDENAVVVSGNVLRLEPDLRLGDWVTFTLEGRETQWLIVGITPMVGNENIVYVNYPYFSRLLGTAGRVNGLWIETTQHSPEFQDQVRRALEERFKQEGWPVANALTVAQIRELNAFFFNIIIALLSIMAVLMAVIGGLGLMGTMSLNVLERTREIGVMRAIGASDGTVQQIVISEGVMIGILSWLAALALAWPMSRYMSDVVGLIFVRAPLSFTFSLGGALFWLVFVIIIGAAASFVPARSVAHMSVKEALAYE